MSGLLLTSNNIYGIINPPPDPSDDLPEDHQDISSAAVRWDNFVDLRDNLGSQLVAGQNINIVGNVISSTGGGLSGGTERITDISLISNSLIELTFNNQLEFNENYNKEHFTIEDNEKNINISELICKDGKLLILLDLSMSDISLNIFNGINPYYYESFNDQSHLGINQNQGTYETGIGNFLYGKKSDGTTPIFKLDVESDLLTNTECKSLSFWVKDYTCEEGKFLFSSGSLSMMSLFSVQLYVETGEDEITLFGQNVSKIYFDGEELTMGPSIGNSNREITPTLKQTECSGWHHWYIEADSYFRTIEILSFEGTNFGTATLDEIKLFSSVLDISQIKVLSLIPEYQELNNLNNIKLSYISGGDISRNLLTNKGYVQNTIWTSNKVYYDKLGVESDYQRDLDLGKQISDLSNAINNAISSSESSKFLNNRNQVLYELLTQQPAIFTKNGVSSSAGTISVNWHYDDIVAKTYQDVLAKLAFQQETKKKLLPFIDQLIIEISGNITTGNQVNDMDSNTWITYSNGIWPKTFVESEIYDQNIYKTVSFSKTLLSNANNGQINNILSKLDSFDIRVYGTNHAENYPIIDDRALYFTDLSFAQANPPSILIFVSENSINSGTSISFIVKVNETEGGEPTSDAVIIDASSSYYPIETNSSDLQGTPIPNPIQYSQVNQSINNVDKDTNFTINLTGLRYGTKYTYFSSVRNDLTSNTVYSQSCDVQTSELTRLPASLNSSTFSSSWFNVSNYIYKVSTPDGNWPTNLSNSSIIWLNKAVSNYNSLNLNNNTRTFEISKTYSNNQQIENVGYGKFIDNSTNLVNINIEISGNKFQELKFGGFDVQPSRDNFNNNTFNYFDSPTVSDPYNNNSNAKGFRLNGTMKLNDIPYNNINDPSNVSFNVSFTYNKLAELGGNTINKSLNLYIDDLTGAPEIDIIDTETSIQSVVYCMGIPSVQEFDVSFSRIYKNINSEYRFCRYHTSSPAGITVGLISNITKTNRSSSSFQGKININRTDINENGIYEFSSTEIDTQTSDRFKNIYFKQSIGIPTTTDNSPTDSFNITEQSYNLNSEYTETNSYNIDYYCDYNSFNKSSNKITTAKLDLTNIFEIDDITVFNTNTGSVDVNTLNHNTVVKDWTLLYINGGFKTNAAQSYPIVNEYNWNLSSDSTQTPILTSYNAYNKSYDLDGNVTTNDSGYKWIVFKASISSDSITYAAGGVNKTIIDIPSFLNNFNITSQNCNKLKDSNDSDIIGFIKQEVNNAVRIGTLDSYFNSGNTWYKKSSNLSLDNLFNGSDSYKYGTLEDKSSTEWGPNLEINLGADDIHIFIGFKNSINLNN